MKPTCAIYFRSCNMPRVSNSFIITRNDSAVQCSESCEFYEAYGRVFLQKLNVSFLENNFKCCRKSARLKSIQSCCCTDSRKLFVLYAQLKEEQADLPSTKVSKERE